MARTSYSKYCDECQVDFEVFHSESAAFFPIMHCPFCAAVVSDEDEDDVDYALDLDENDESETSDY